MLGTLVFGGAPGGVEAGKSLFSPAPTAPRSNAPAVRAGGGTETALGLCRFRGEEWSMCVLSMVIKEKEIFHWVLGEGFHSASVLW